MEEISDVKLCLSQEWDLLAENNTEEATHCPPAWDGFSCWAPTLAGATATSSCPSFKGSDITKSAFRVCSDAGKWLDKDGVPSSIGWTNYTPCLTPEILEIIRRLGANDDAQTKMNIASNTRILEFVGLSLSLAALLLSLLIFYYFRTLRNSRTRLHRHLFIAVVIQVAIRLTVYTDQLITRGIEVDGEVTTQDNNNLAHSHRGIDNTPYLCEASYISLEYARTAMFMWMFVEGLYLHNMITVSVFEEKLSPRVYQMVGWIVPIPLTVVWAVVTQWQYGHSTCWWGYNLTGYYWILEGPRLAVLMVNLGFLLNILRVLIMKLRQSSSSETQQALKAVKAALVLLPLLGLTNLLNMLDAPLEKSPLKFALWSYSTHLLSSTQGLILAFLYCFRNGEVQMVVRKFVRIRLLGNSKQMKLTKKLVQIPALGTASKFLPNAGAPQSPAEKQRALNSAILQQSYEKPSPPRTLKVRTFCDGVIKQTTIRVGVEQPKHHKQNEQNRQSEGRKSVETSQTTAITSPVIKIVNFSSSTDRMQSFGPSNDHNAKQSGLGMLSNWRMFIIPDLLRKSTEYKIGKNQTVSTDRCDFI